MFRKTKAVEETRPRFPFPWFWHVIFNVANEGTCCDGIRMVTLRDRGETNTYIAFSRNWDISFTKETRLNLRDHVLNFITYSSFASCRDFLHASWRYVHKHYLFKGVGGNFVTVRGLKVSLCFCITTLAMFQWYFPSIVHIVYFPKMVK